MRKVIIAGSRDLDPPVEMIDTWMQCLKKYFDIEPSEIVSGGCRGVDMAGERWAKARGVPIKRFAADWRTHGRAAGPIRNRQMAEYADFLIALYRPGSKGTANMIKEADRCEIGQMLFGLDPNDEVER